MRAGTMRHQITIQRATVTRDTFGAEVETWEELATVWAAVEPLSGRELIAAAAATADLSTRVRIRYRVGIKPTDRVVYGDRTLEILTVIDLDERHREMHLMCREVV